MPPSRCPTCDKPVPSARPERPKAFPFCSERCQLIDLGKWLNEDYRISTPIESPEQVEELLNEQENTENTHDARPDVKS